MIQDITGLESASLSMAVPHESAPGEASIVTESERVFLVVVDESAELRAAVRFAAQRAAKTGGRVALFYTVEPTEFQHWMFVGNLMQEEKREEAERILQRHAATVSALSGRTPIIFMREGDTNEQLLELLEEEPGISVLVLATSEDTEAPGPLVQQMIGRMTNRMPVPVTLVPGNLSDEQIDLLS